MYTHSTVVLLKYCQSQTLMAQSKWNKICDDSQNNIIHNALNLFLIYCPKIGRAVAFVIPDRICEIWRDETHPIWFCYSMFVGRDYMFLQFVEKWCCLSIRCFTNAMPGVPGLLVECDMQCFIPCTTHSNCFSTRICQICK